MVGLRAWVGGRVGRRLDNRTVHARRVIHALVPLRVTVSGSCAGYLAQAYLINGWGMNLQGNGVGV